MAEIRTLKLNLLADVNSFGKSLKTAETKVTGFQGTVHTASKKMGAAFAALAASAGAAAIAIGKDAVKAAIEDQAAQVKLSKALQNTTKASNLQIASVEKWITKQQLALGVSDKQLRPAYANLTRATGDLGKAQNLTNLAMDISAATGKDLESVSLALAKAHNGNIGALTRLGVPLDANIVKTNDFAKATAVLEKMFGGSAAAAADTYDGKLRRVSEGISEAKENLGSLLLPMVSKFVNFANQHLIPALNDIYAGFKNSSEQSKTSSYIFGSNIKYMSDQISSVGNQLQSVGLNWSAVLSSAFGGIFIQITGRLNSLVKTIKMVKQYLGIKDTAKSDATVAESRDAARAAGRTGPTDSFTSLLDKLPIKGAKAAKAVNALAQAFDAYAKSVSGAISGAIDFSTAFSDKGESSFMDALRRQAQLAYEFGGKISRLVQQGLSRGALSQIIAAGPVVGSQIASELLSGGAGAIAETNTLVGGIESFSQQVGQYATMGVSGRGNAALGAGGINITINGAVDPEGVRRQLEQLFQDSARRIGAVSLVGATL